MLLVNAIFLNYSPIKTMFKNIHYVEKNQKVYTLMYFKDT